MADNGEATPSSMSYLTPPSTHHQERATMPPPEVPWEGPTSASAYAPYGAPWPATFEKPEVTETIYVTIEPLQRGRPLGSKSKRIRKIVKAEAKKKNLAIDPALENSLPAERPGKVEAADGEAGSPDSAVVESSEQSGSQRTNDTQCELRLHSLSSPPDIAGKTLQTTKKVFRAEKRGGIRVSYTAVLGRKINPCRKRAFSDEDETEVGEFVPAQKLRRKKGIWDLKAGVGGI